MNPFEYYIPTKVIFGEGEVKRIGEVAAEFGKTAMLVSYDKDFIESIGLLGKTLTPLKEAGVQVIEHFGVKSNPTVEFVREGVTLCKQTKPDVIIALGGGSVMDTAKAMAAGATSENDIWDMASGKAAIEAALPIVTIVTIPATSSEMNPTSVISNDELRRKEGFGHPVMFPKVSILDPELTYSIPVQLTAISAADIVSHLMEGYINHFDEWAPMQDRFAQGMIKTVIESMDILLDDPNHKQARAIMMWAAAFAWNGFYVCGIGGFEPCIHMLGHSFSAFYDLPHGSAMSVSIPGCMKYHLKDRAKKYAEFAKEVFSIVKECDECSGQAGIDAITDWFKKIGVPTSFAEANMPTDEFDAMADDVLITARNWGIESYDKKMVLELLELCK
jgi:alcohol dehydrogenase YqhD (iron-dependent ADH family)